MNVSFQAPLAGQLYGRVDFNHNTGEEYSRPTTEGVTLDDANVMTSKVALDPAVEAAVGPLHKPVLDIDLPVQVIPSSTEGHNHLIIDKPMTWEKYQRLLDALADCGVIESGYRNASIARGYTAVRLPWVKKKHQPEPVPMTPDTVDTDPESF
ncbi:hypothetical protein FHR83_007076 [Actinoplanes campanulatus]|uniref:Uncharacterized protein n=1 Tax=Actinoplanes campanulatus TaxID=113559 RepID=A0A7W5FID9_9ACTN|nr:hypothetical protein [Actinoplanes campanulatus]MBB3099370.1 hypothetical protein [Actinoplanes campanulatus]GGN40254.1 hypothetical protein GCM10010109_69160 [Actinoplanes campanulatus]GID42421.1 hypothetical protein Aca09nite_89270 [Actinoplanes campanulatus]